MAEWRFLHGWTEKELEERLNRLGKQELNFPLLGPQSQSGKNWRRYYSESIIGLENPGPPVKGGAFELAWKALNEYQFSDPGIVTAHFRPSDPLLKRNMLLEIKVLGLSYLCGVRVGGVKEESKANETQKAFRYDTLTSHIEVGSEWFTVTKKHDTGEVWFRISASWRPGKFPNWWSRVGFEILGRRFQLSWHRLAYLRLREIVGSGGRGLVPIPRGEGLVHTGAEIEDSALWVLNEPSATARVIETGKDKTERPTLEDSSSSSSPVHQPTSTSKTT